MLRTIVLSLLLLLPLHATADEAGNADAAAVRQVIEQQLQAFQADDGNTAFSFATPVLQQKFRSPDIFMEMVRSGYDPVYRPRQVEFQGADLRAEGIVQKVLFVDRDGRAWMAHYTMSRMSDGSWKIAAVRLEKLPDLST